MDNRELLLPPEIPAMVGKEINIYFDNLLAENVDRYYVNVICEVGRHQNERWTFVPETAGQYPLTIELYQDTTTKLAEAATMIRVCDPAAGGDSGQVGASDAADNPYSVLFIGDSTTAAGLYTQELLKLFRNDPQSLTLIGTQGADSNRHEGWGGRTVRWFYADEESPFVFDGRFNFSNYMKSNGYRQADIVCIHLGINDVYYMADDAAVRNLLEEEMPMLDNMIASIREYNRDAVIGIMLTIPPSRHQDSFGSSYGTGIPRWRYKRHLVLWTNELIARYGGRTAERIELVPVNVNLDTVHNMMSREEYANSRSTALVARQTDGVHPAPEGYAQMADVLYYWLNRILQSK